MAARYRVQLSFKAQRQLDALPKQDKQRATADFDDLSSRRARSSTAANQGIEEPARREPEDPLPAVRTTLVRDGGKQTANRANAQDHILANLLNPRTAAAGTGTGAARVTP